MKQSQHKSLPNLMSELRDRLKQIDNSLLLNENIISEAGLSGKVRGASRKQGGTASSNQQASSKQQASAQSSSSSSSSGTSGGKSTASTTSSGTGVIPAVAGAAGAGAAGVALWRQARKQRTPTKPNTTPVPAKPTTGPGRRILNAKPRTIKAALAGLMAGSLAYMFYDEIKDYAGKAVDAFNDYKSSSGTEQLVIHQPARQGESGTIGNIIDEIKSIMLDLRNYSDARIPPAFANAVAAVREVEKDRAAELSAIKPKQ